MHKYGRKKAKRFNRHWKFFELFALWHYWLLKGRRLGTKSCSYHLIFTKSSANVQILWSFMSFPMQFTWIGAAQAGCRDCKLSLKPFVMTAITSYNQSFNQKSNRRKSRLFVWVCGHACSISIWRCLVCYCVWRSNE